MSLRVLLLVVLGLLVAAPAWAQDDAPKKEAAEEGAPAGEKAEKAPAEKAADEKAPKEEASSGEPEKAAPEEGDAPADAPKGEKKPTDTAKPTPSPDGPAPVAPAPAPAPAPTPKGHGLVVVAGDAEARGQARNLARIAYKDASLRPRIDEATARVLAGDPAPKDDAGLNELASTVAAVSTLKDDAVRRRLLGAMSRELGVQRAVLVETGAKGPRARVVEGGRFRGVTLTASQRPDGTWDWSDAVAMLRGLAVGTPVPGPRRTGPQPKEAPKPTSTAPAEGADDEDEFNLLTSPWFWGGLGVVVTVGVTVFVLSRTALNEPDEVVIQGRIAP